MGSNRVLRGVLAAGIATAVSLAASSPASALKLRYVEEVEVAPADAITTVESFCRSGFSVTGGGAFSNGAYAQTKIQDTHPIDGPDSDFKPDDGWRASIWNTASTAGNIESQAICAKNLATKVRTQAFSPGGTPPNVACPDGMTATGGGIETAGGFTIPATILSSRPGDESAGGRVKTWFVNADPPETTSIQAFGYAICVDKRRLNLEYRSAGFTVDNLTQGSGPALCEPGERVLGPGGATNATQSALVTIFGTDSVADTDLRLDDGATITVDNYNASPDIFPEAYAVCVHPPQP